MGYGVGLCLALFCTECLKSVCMCGTWVINQRTGIRLRTAALALSFEKLLQFRSLTHISSGEVSARAAPWFYLREMPQYRLWGPFLPRRDYAV